MQDPIAERNMLALKKKSFEIHFCLDGTNYEAIEKIGIGAYGVVCSARHTKTKQSVAIKKIPNIFEQPTIAKRTYREIRILKHFKHDNIIAIQEILAPPQVPSQFRDVYIVLDLMESDLHRIIHSKQQLTDEHVRYFLYQLLRGLKYIHSANVVHRDLKPSNLLINENCDLKIGDFGMARGMCDMAVSENNMMMTQYVATRWYRAPELLMLATGYSAAVDIWSVGCILGEMLTKQQLFPGQNYIDQLKLIIGVLGTPPDKFLRQTNSDMLRQFITGLGQKEPVPFNKLCPKAPPEALDLLRRTLSLDPDYRITVQEALNHPYLKKYHDPDDEPICVPLFDFSFEKQELDSGQLKECILKEIQDYHKPTITKVFNLRPVPKGELTSSVKASSCASTAAGLNAFLHMQKPGQTSEQSLLEQMQMSVASLQRLQSDMDFPKPVNVPQASKKPPRVATQTDDESTSDIEMLSAKTTSIEISSHDKDDVVMLSAKLSEEKCIVQALEVKKETAALDAKAQLKAALLQATLRRQRHEESGEKPRPVTAQQRQKEREEKRRKKMQRVMERKKKQSKKKEEEDILKLTDDDKNLLKRWKSMQKPGVATCKDDSQPESLSTGIQPSQTLPAPSNEQSAADVTLIRQKGDLMTGTQSGPQHQQKKITAEFPNDDLSKGRNHSTETSNTQMSSSNMGVSQGMGMNANFSNFSVNTKCRSANEEQGTSVAQQNVFGMNVAIRGEYSVPDAEVCYTHPPALFGEELATARSWSQFTDNHTRLPPSYDEAVQPSDSLTQSLLKPTPTTHPVISSTMMHYPGVDGINHQPVVETAGTSYPANAALQMTTYPDIPPDLLGKSPTEFGIPESSQGVQGYPDVHDLPEAPDLTTQPVGRGACVSEDLTTSITRLLGRSHMEDLTLAQTPKGTGGGYGVGLDLDEVLRDSMGNTGSAIEEQELAPLSASLIADWLQVTSTMDPKDMETLQRELGITSPAVFSDLTP